MARRGRMTIEAQPDDETCGPTCLHAVYRYFGDDLPLERVIEEVPKLDTGGTLGVLLGCHALSRGYKATLYTCNLKVFDPIWFAAPRTDLAAKLREQLPHKKKEKIQLASHAYLRFLELGGRIQMRDITRELLRRHLRRRVPLLTGLSATWLYRCAREYGDDKMVYDDLRGLPQGHFVVLHDYEEKVKRVHVADPLAANPLYRRHHYVVEIDRLVSAIHLGVLTYDANLLVLQPAATPLLDD